MSYIVLRGRWYNIIVLNVHAPSEDKCDDSKDSFYEELEQVFDHFPMYHMKILLEDFNTKVGRENIFKPTIGNESLRGWIQNFPYWCRQLHSSCVSAKHRWMVGQPCLASLLAKFLIGGMT